MKQNRRDFFKQSALLSGALWGLSFPGLAQDSLSEFDPLKETRLPVLQGITSETATQINILANKKISCVVTTLSGSKHIRPNQETIAKKPYSNWVSHKLFLNDLLPGTVYRLAIYDETDTLIDSREFSPLKPEARHVRFAFASCMRDTPKAGIIPEMWGSLEATQPDLLFLLGDNVYVDDGPGGSDPVTEEKLWRRYVEARQKITLYKLPRLIPTLATWDDHDFGKNNTYGHTDWSDTARDVFRAVYAQDAVIPEVTWGPGIATHFMAFGQQFSLMDDRSFREPQVFGNDHWGKTQENWLFNLIDRKNVPTWILNGSQIFGAYRTGWSLEHHPKAFKRVMKKLKALEAPVLFASGDVHYSEIMKIESDFLGYESLEITSSSMHSNAKSPRSGNTRRMMSTGEFNFVIADVDVREKGLDLSLRSLGAKGKAYFELDSFRLKR